MMNCPFCKASIEMQVEAHEYGIYCCTQARDVANPNLCSECHLEEVFPQAGITICEECSRNLGDDEGSNCD